MATLHLDPLPRNASAGEVLRFVCDAAGIDGKLVGKITFQPRGATVELPDSHAARAVTNATPRKIAQSERCGRFLASGLICSAFSFSESIWLPIEQLARG